MDAVTETKSRVAGIDVHKKMLAVVVAERSHPDKSFQERKFGTDSKSLQQLREWLQEQQVDEGAMESTAQYWKPVWMELEEHMKLHLAQPRSTTGARGRKSDFRDARRIVKRLLADDLTLSYVPDPEQRTQRMVARTRTQLTEDRTRIQNQVECLLEEGRIKLAAVVSDLLGVTSRRILRALAEGVEDVGPLAASAAQYLGASEEQLRNALNGRMNSTHRRLLKMELDRIEAVDRDIAMLEQELAGMMFQHQDEVQRLCEVPGMGVMSAEQTIAEVGSGATRFEGPEKLASWIGTCPGREESAEKSVSNRSPKGNRSMRRLLTQVAWAAVKTKGCFFQHLFRRLVPKLGTNKAIWAVAHRITRVIWMILHEKVRYKEHGDLPADERSLKRRRQKHVRELRRLGFEVALTPATA